MSKSAVAHGASMAASVWSKLDEAVKAKGGTEDALHVLDKKEGAPLIDVIADILVKAELKTRIRFPTTVDYRQSLADMVAAGKYDYANEHIVAKNFPITGEGTVETELILVHFDHDISSEDAVKEMEQMGLEPAKVEHLMAYGAQHWDGKPKLVAALGSSRVCPRGYRYVPYLLGWRGGRGLGLLDWGDDWAAVYRFLAVCK